MSNAVRGNAPVCLNPDAALENYRAVMARRDAMEADPEWAPTEEWCDEEQAALARLAAEPGDLRDLLNKVIIMARRQEECGGRLMDVEADLVASMRRQAERMLRSPAVSAQGKPARRDTDTALECALMDAHGAACALYELMPTDAHPDQLMTGIDYLSSMILGAMNKARKAYYEGLGETYP